MNPNTKAEAKKIFQNITRKKILVPNTTVVVCPPFIYLADIVKSYKGSKFSFGVQDVFWQKEAGAFTGEISIGQIKDLGVKFVILGHSERRMLGETDGVVAKKVNAVLTAGLHVVLCVGENERDSDGEHLKYIENQLIHSLEGVSKKMIKNLIIAYEPVWAIGKGKSAMLPEDISRTVLFIRKILSEIYGRKLAQDISVIYGGSADATNAHEIIINGHVDGLLPGRASLHSDEFAGIINAVSKK